MLNRTAHFVSGREASGWPAPGMTPAHSRTLQPLRDQGLARRLHHPRANRHEPMLERLKADRGERLHLLEYGTVYLV